MRLLHLGLAFALLIGWTVAAEAAKPKGQKKGAATAGVVTAVTKDKDSGSITIQVHQGKKNKGAPAIEKTFKVTSTTTFQSVKKVKGQKQPEKTAAVFSDVQKGSRVRIQASADDTAVSVTIQQGGKKK